MNSVTAPTAELTFMVPGTSDKDCGGGFFSDRQESPRCLP